MTTETDLCAALIPYLEQRGYTLYYEVRVGSDVADIVAVHNHVDRAVTGVAVLPSYLVIEAKLGLCLRLLAQADRWRGSAHRVAIAIPERQLETIDYATALDWCRWKQVGVLAVTDRGFATQIMPAIEQVHGNGAALAPYLTEAQRTYAAPGNSDGKRATRYQLERDKVVAAVQQTAGRHGLTLAQVSHITGIRSEAVKAMLGAGIEGVRAERHGTWRLYPV